MSSRRKLCLYCGPKKVLPPGWDGMGDKFVCLKKGFGAGKYSERRRWQADMGYKVDKPYVSQCPHTSQHRIRRHRRTGRSRRHYRSRSVPRSRSRREY